MAELDPQAEAQAAFLFKAARALDDDERMQSEQQFAQAKEALSAAEESAEQCRSEEAKLAETRSEVRANLSTAMEAWEAALYDGLCEKVALGPSCDDLAIAGRIRPLEDRVTFQQGACDLVEFVLTPQAHESTLKANVKVCEFRHLVASLVAILHHDKQSRLLGPLLELEGHVAVFGTRGAALRANAAELLRLWKLSEGELGAYQRSQAARQQARMSQGLTRAEAVAGAVARRKAITE